MKKCFLLAFVVVVGFIGVSSCAESEPKNQKFALILQAGIESHEGTARTLHALLYSQELIEAGNNVVLIFDGAGTT